MKYTFEIMKEYEDAFRGISAFAVSEDKNLIVDFVAREELEDAQKQVEEAYQRGLEDGKAQVNHGCEGCAWDGTPFDVCSKCRNSYGNLYKRKEPRDKIEVGDEVIDKDGDKTIVTNIHSELFDGLCYDGSTMSDLFLDDVDKTGRHFDIDKILEEVRT